MWWIHECPNPNCGNRVGTTVKPTVVQCIRPGCGRNMKSRQVSEVEYKTLFDQKRVKKAKHIPAWKVG